ncbi:PIR protein [Plasmodium ovale]|uniref:PIR Superfamily Protein n=2 Tax=Plasmodium ovale TaxID=36330 RepID=A0A1A8X3J7_PLAOA|nr:PIR Superfamily Protein [Plasmodium ovale curtisi]SBT83744.1 PIR protein [Plasmodium ovale]
MVSGRYSKDIYFQKFEKTAFQDCSIAVKYLNDIKSNNEKLYEIGCSLDKAYKYADILYSKRTENYYICLHLNDWLNKKKDDYIYYGNSCENSELWNTYIEVLWEKLGKEDERNHWCVRSTINYGCFNYSKSRTPVLVVFSLLTFAAVAFFIFYDISTCKSWIINKIYNKGKIKQSTDEDGSHMLPHHSFINVSQYNKKKRINFLYHSSENS